MYVQTGLCNDVSVCLYLAAQHCRWTVINVVEIYFIPWSLAGREHSLTPDRLSFSRPLIRLSSEHLIRSMKWGLRLPRQRFEISRKIRSILINYPSHWIVHICLRWGRGRFASGRSGCLNMCIKWWGWVAHKGGISSGFQMQCLGTS